MQVRPDSRRNAARQAIEATIRLGAFTHDEAHELLTELANRYREPAGLLSLTPPPLVPDPPEPTRPLTDRGPSRIAPLSPAARGSR